MTYRLSIAERIALTSGFRTSSEKAVLMGLASFADFETGARACPSWERLQTRVPDLSRRTIARCLARLEADGWIEGRHRQRRPTTYRICLERLATSATIAKVVVNNVPDLQIGSAKMASTPAEIGSAILSSGSATLTPGSAKLALHPDQYPDLYPSAPPLRVGSQTDPPTTTATTENPRGESDPIESPPSTPDVCADCGDHPDLAAGRPRGPGGDHSTPPRVGLHVPERSDSPRPESPDGPRPSAAPHQQTLGPLDVSAVDEQHRRFMAELRARVAAPKDAQRKSG